MTEAQESRRFWKSLNRCVQCHSKDAFTLMGRCHCADCAEKDRAYKKKSYEKRKARINATRAAEREMRRETGLCTFCGAPLPPDCGYRSCDKCRAYFRNRKRRENEQKTGESYGVRSRRWEFGLCTRCGSPIKEGLTAEGRPFRLCERCYDGAMIALAKANATHTGGKENHPWTKDNVIAFGNTAKFLRLNG